MSNSDEKILRSSFFLPINYSSRPTSRNKGLLALYFTIPINLVTNNLSESSEKIFREYEIITGGSENVDVQIMVSCNIILENRLTNDEKIYYGHFSFFNEKLTTLSPFTRGVTQNLIKNKLKESISQESIEEVLKKPFVESCWTLKSLRGNNDIYFK